MHDANPPREPGPDVPFEIGLVMAGAISAGAYTAGVVSFLVEALDAWEAAKRRARRNPDDPESRACPMHEVRLKVMAGTSAGGMTAGLAAGLLGMAFDPVALPSTAEAPARPANNNLYRSWVDEIDIGPLLGVRDLDRGGAVQSVLDSTVLRDIADAAFRFERPGDRAPRAFLSDPLHVLLTVTNLRGVPYALDFENWAKGHPHEMLLHADHLHFALAGDEAACPPGSFWLKPYDFENSETWGVLRSASLATGAFPVGLAPRLLRRPRSHYDERRWPVPGPREVDGVHYCETWEKIPPSWPEAPAGGAEAPYEFLCVDGGVTNNEPLDLARRTLAGEGGRNPREGDKASRATILILPFPNRHVSREGRYDSDLDLFGLISETFHGVVGQARFKPEELALANDPNVYSRFLIVPRRVRPDGTPEAETIACGSLHGFGGFLSRRFREHDYQLGRRNCQRFLKQYFALPSEGDRRNKLFDRWTPEARARHRIVAARKGTAGTRDDASGEVLPLLPIIPLVGPAARPVPEPKWPRMTPREVEALRPLVDYRLKRVVGALVDQTVSGSFWDPVARAALKSAWWMRGGVVADKLMATVHGDLVARGLLDDEPSVA